MEKKKIKLWKKVLIAVFLILLILVSILLVRYNILTNIQEKNEESNNKLNSYYYSETEETTMEYWRKDNVMKLNVKHKNNEADITFWKDTNTNEELIFLNKPEKYYSKSNGGMVERLPQSMTFTTEKSSRLLMAAMPILSISSEKYENKDCYHLKINNQEEIIQRDSGLILFSNNGESRKLTYSFDNVIDSDVQKPNIEEYKFLENN